MPDNLTTAQRKSCMSKIRGTNTKPEQRIRRELWHRGFRYLINDVRLPGKPDLVLPKYRTVIFVHGCFWHGHTGCKKFSLPKTNEEYWWPKIARNQQRDQEVWRQLEAIGWSVIIVWECELRKVKLEETINRVQTELIRNREAYLSIVGERHESQKEYILRRRIQAEREYELKKEIMDSFAKPF